MRQNNSSEQNIQNFEPGGNRLFEVKPSSDQKYKLLLLGAADAGKSTIFKQLRLHFCKESKENPYLQRNVNLLEENIMIISVFFTNLRSLLLLLFKLYGTTGDATVDRHINNLNRNWYKRYVMNGGISSKGVNFVSKIWESKNAQEVWKRRNEFQLSESLEYFCQQEVLNRMKNYKFEAISEDYLQCQITTCGIWPMQLNINGQNTLVVDIGGRRAERAKWRQEFNDVSAIMFVVALDDFDKVLFEDTRTNRWDESVKLLATVSHSRDLKKSTPFILILNRVDLFRRKMAAKENDGVNLDEYFPELALGDNYEEAVPQVLDYMEQQLVASLRRAQPYVVQYVNAIDQNAFSQWFTNSYEWMENVSSRS